MIGQKQKMSEYKTYYLQNILQKIRRKNWQVRKGEIYDSTKGDDNERNMTVLGVLAISEKGEIYTSNEHLHRRITKVEKYNSI